MNKKTTKTKLVAFDEIYKELPLSEKFWIEVESLRLKIEIFFRKIRKLL